MDSLQNKQASQGTAQHTHTQKKNKKNRKTMNEEKPFDNFFL